MLSHAQKIRRVDFDDYLAQFACSYRLGSSIRPDCARYSINIVGRIGLLGVCGSGGFGLAAAEIDPRIKAVATVSMYDIGQGQRQGLAAELDNAAVKKQLSEIADQRWAEVDGAPRMMAVGTPEVLTENSHPIEREFFDYYRTALLVRAMAVVDLGCCPRWRFPVHKRVGTEEIDRCVEVFNHCP